MTPVATLLPPPPGLLPPLLPGERLLGHGRPRRGLVVRRADLALIPFGLVAAMVVGTTDAPHAIGAALAAYVVAGRFAIDAWRRGRRHYAVTDLRLVIGRGGERTQLDLHTLPRLDLRPLVDGCGTLLLAADDLGGLRGLTTIWHEAMDVPRQFYRLRDAAAVRDLIRAARTA